MSTAEQQPQGEATDTLSSQSSDDDKPLPDYGTALKTQKIPALYQRNLAIVYDRKQIIFNPFCLIFSFQIKRKTNYILENSCIVTKCQVRQNFFDLPFTSHILA